jgi:5'-nucleotidase
MRRSSVLKLFCLVVAAGAVLGLSRAIAAQPGDHDVSIRPLTLSIVGTSDLHGYYKGQGEHGGVGVFAGYVHNLRAARAADGGAVLLLDAGDTFQGGVDSDLSEGALVVDAYNALGYTALAIGNHDFEFGPADAPGAREPVGADARGALKARAAQAHFPFLAANLIDDATGRPVDWPNVRPSMTVEAAGIKVGIVGVMTAFGLRATLPLNVRGLHMAPLAEAVTAQARSLRAAGATIVLVAAHAGGGCDKFDNPRDLSTCDPTAEIFDLARDVQTGLIDAIVAGHTHAGIAHEVAGIPIVQSYWGGRAFGRIDLTVDRATGRVIAGHPFAPRDICASEDPRTGQCVTTGDAAVALRTTRYEGQPVEDDGVVEAAMRPALARVQQLRDARLGVVLDTPIPRTGDPESPLGNLFADALRETQAADIALNNNSLGGLRADLPQGPLTFGRLYDVFPFDNRLVRVTLTGDTLEHGIASALRRGRRGAFGISGATMRVSCDADGPRVQLFHLSGEPIGQNESLVVVGMDSLLGGQLFAPAIPAGSVTATADAPIVREVVEDWLRQRGGQLRVDQFLDPSRRRLEFAGASAAASCQSH